MEINKTGFISELKLRSSGDRGWMTGVCPFCHSKDKLGVLLESDSDRKPHFHCFKASCGRAGSLAYLARFIGHPELASGEYVAPMDIEMALDKPDEDVTTKVFKLPLGFKRTMAHEYLDKRGIDEFQRSLYKFGVSNIDPKIGRDYLITIVEEDGNCVGYVSRSTWNKVDIDKWNESNPEKQFPRYKNSESDFGKLVFGIDEIIPSITKTMVLVEGMYDKMAVDRKLNLNTTNNRIFADTKCGCSFGTKLSDIQAYKLASRGIENIIILYDSGVVNKSKKVSKLASSYFKSVKIGTLTEGDPDESSAYHIYEAVIKSKSIIEYAVGELEEFEL